MLSVFNEIIPRSNIEELLYLSFDGCSSLEHYDKTYASVCMGVSAYMYMLRGIFYAYCTHAAVVSLHARTLNGL